MRPQGITVEREIARIASGSHGVVTHVELVRAGLSPAGIQRRVRKGSLILQHRGVYRVGHSAPSVEALYLAAVRACGEEALLAGVAAAHLFRLIKGQPPRPEVVTRGIRRVEGVKTRRCRSLHPLDRATHRRIPVTTVPRTLVDLAAILSLDALARACHEAGVLYRTTPKHVEAVLARRPTSPGAANLRRVMRGDVHVTLSKLERAFLDLLRGEGLQLPQTNRSAGGRRVDCRWPEQRLTAELLGYQFHNSRHAWDQDHRRAREARKRGDRFRSYTWTDVFEDPTDMLRELRELLPAA
jgi:Transcriptional regulator, AbiEi antitoxin